MDIAAELQTALESLVTAYKAACANPRPNYSLDGQSFSWKEYLAMLQDGIRLTQDMIVGFDPIERRTNVL